MNPVDVHSELTIAAVERATGLSKDLLRVWERRYGFPAPRRDGAGERAYSQEQVARLRVVKRLLDAGHRPGRVLQLGADALRALAAKTGQAEDRQAPATGSALADGAREQLLSVLRGHDLAALAVFLRQQLAAAGPAGISPQGVQRAAALHAALADAWLRGQLEAFEERACQQQLQTLLREALAQMARDGSAARARAPRVLLTTLPGEPQETGVLLAQALLAWHGCDCMALGPQLAPWDAARAARAYQADVVVLGFSGTLAPNAAVQGLTELRLLLPPTLALWACGSTPVLQRRKVAGVKPLAALRDLLPALATWREARAAQGPLAMADELPAFDAQPTGAHPAMQPATPTPTPTPTPQAPRWPHVRA